MCVVGVMGDPKKNTFPAIGSESDQNYYLSSRLYDQLKLSHTHTHTADTL